MELGLLCLRNMKTLANVTHIISGEVYESGTDYDDSQWQTRPSSHA